MLLFQFIAAISQNGWRAHSDADRVDAQVFIVHAVRAKHRIDYCLLTTVAIKTPVLLGEVHHRQTSVVLLAAKRELIVEDVAVFLNQFLGALRQILIFVHTSSRFPI